MAGATSMTTFECSRARARNSSVEVSAFGVARAVCFEPRTGKRQLPRVHKADPDMILQAVHLRDRVGPGRSSPRARVGIRRLGPACGETELSLRRHALSGRPAHESMGKKRLSPGCEPARNQALVLFFGARRSSTWESRRSTSGKWSS